MTFSCSSTFDPCTAQSFITIQAEASLKQSQWIIVCHITSLFQLQTKKNLFPLARDGTIQRNSCLRKSHFLTLKRIHSVKLILAGISYVAQIYQPVYMAVFGDSWKNAHQHGQQSRRGSITDIITQQM